jgi:N-methylhydantoinase A
LDNRYRLGIDIGGTFTDLLLMNEDTGDLFVLKTPSTHWPVEAVSAGIQELQQRYGITPSEIVYFSHGTTLAVNTLLQRSGARVGVLVTKGFRDILELRRLRLPKANDFFIPRPVSLVPRRHVKEVDERILANGQIYIPLRQQEVEQRVQELVAEGVEAVAVCFLHAYRNQTHELLAKRWIEELDPDLYVCTSAEIWPQQREYERSLISVINAHVGGRMRDYFHTLQTDMAELGMRCRVFSTKSNGGVMSAEKAAERPVETLLSGPASGVIGATYIGRIMGDDRLVTLDMGGTSVDIAIIQGEIPYSTENTVGDFPVIMPAVDVSSIGAGGGSIAWTDAEGVLKVGPESAGAEPGPACYGRAGQAPTITDAYLAVGIINPDNFLGGEMRLNPQLGKEAIDRVGERLGFDTLQTADAILQVATASIYAELLPQMARRGIDPRDFSILAYGGAGPTHVFMLARDLNVRRIIVPPTPGILCALGCLVADMRADFVQTIWRDCHQVSDEELQAIYRRLEHEAQGWLAAESADVEHAYLLRSADMCFSGQSFELNIPFPNRGEFSAGIDQTMQWFYDRYEQAYGYADRAAPVRLLEARVQIVGVAQKPAIKPITREGSAQMGGAATRMVHDRGTSVQAMVYQRAALRQGQELEGPAIIEQYDTTIYIPAGFRATVDEWFNLVGEALR